VCGDALLEVRVVLVELRDDVAFESAAVEPFAEIDEIVHDILTMMS
jgi:hypothetical protein